MLICTLQERAPQDQLLPMCKGPYPGILATVTVAERRIKRKQTRQQSGQLGQSSCDKLLACPLCLLSGFPEQLFYLLFGAPGSV
jgi:hypothetical protein